MALSLCGVVCPQETGQKPGDLASASLEDLMKVEVTSVSKQEQSLSRTPAAVFVITEEDIQQSGARNIPDLLRMVPGMDVAQINASTWAVSARGLSGEFSNELLVLIDGRNVYTPTFGGVYWDSVDLPLENIARIEVIRGPGAAVWGENAVNGVVNIIRKKAASTHGLLVTAGAGTAETAFGTVRYGGAIGNKVDYRLYAKYFDERPMGAIDRPEAGDGWHLLRAGTRTDTQLSNSDTLTVQGDMYTGREGNPTLTLPSIFAPGPVEAEQTVNLSGGFVQSIWNHTFSERSDTTLSGSYDAYKRSDAVNDHRRTVSLDFQHQFLFGGRQSFVWGATYRFTTAESTGSARVELLPQNQTETIYSFFAQDEIEAIAGRLYITLGSKFENNTYSGFEAMPTARAVYQFSPRRMGWVGASRAVRSPAELDTSLRANEGAFIEPDGTLAVVSIFGNAKAKDEELQAYEAGYRMTVGRTVSVDLAAYYNRYNHRTSDEPGAPFFEATPGPPHLVIPLDEQNLQYGETHGAEMAAKWKVTSRWTIEPSYDFERMHFHARAGSQDVQSGPLTEGSDPRQHGRIRSHVDLGQNVAWNLAAYYTDRLTVQGVPSYTRIDTNLIWRMREDVTLGIYGQNLLKDTHLEFNDPLRSSALSSLIRRSAYAKLTWRF